MGSLTTETAWKEMMETAGLGCEQTRLALHFASCVQAQKGVEELERELEEAAEPFRETLERLQTVPGVGPIVAATFVATLGSAERFPDSKHVVSFIGFAPSGYDSGERERHGKITKQGSSALRGVLCQAAQCAAKVRHPLNPYYRKICAKRGSGKAAVAVAQRIARILYRLWRNQEDFDVTKLNVIAERNVRTGIRA